MKIARTNIVSLRGATATKQSKKRLLPASLRSQLRLESLAMTRFIAMLAMTPLMAFLFVIFLFSPLEVQAQTTPYQYDWPTLAHDNQRSGSTLVGPDGPYTKVWYRDLWAELHEQTADGYQPVAVRDQAPGHTNPDGSQIDLVYVGTSHGSLNALNLKTGEIYWRYPQTGFIGGILVSPTIDNGIVYFGALDGKVYALDGESLTGSNPQTPQAKWIFETRRAGGFWANPVITADSVYIGSRDGYFYALDKQTGARRWEVNVGAMIISSAAYDNNVIYFGAEDMKAYALNAGDGSFAWPQPVNLSGQTMRNRAPVLTDSLVMFRTASPDGRENLLHEGEQVVAWAAGCYDYKNPSYNRDNIPCFNWRAQASSQADYDREDQAVKNYLSGLPTTNPQTGEILYGRPQYQTFFALNRADGQKAFIAPVLLTEGQGNPPTQPVVDKQGRIWVIYRSYYSDYDGGSTTIFDAFGSMDPVNGRITIRNPNPNPTTYSCSATSCNSAVTTNVWMIGDETTAMSVGGNKIYTAHWAGYGSVNLDNGTLESVIGQRDGFSIRLRDNVPRRTPFASGEGAINDLLGPAIFEDKIIVTYASVIAVLQGHLPGATPAPVIPVAPHPDNFSSMDISTPITVPEKTSLEHYAWEVPIINNINTAASSDLRAKLEAGVDDILSLRRAPWMLIPGNVMNPVYFTGSDETTYSLALAYPYLSTDRQVKARDFIRAEWDAFDPLTGSGYPINEGIVYNNGTTVDQGKLLRLDYPPGPRRYCMVVGGCDGYGGGNSGYIVRTIPFDRLYALWLYAYSSGDWLYLERKWNMIKSTTPYYGLKTAIVDDINRYGREAGLLGVGSLDPDCISNCHVTNESANRRISSLIAYSRIAQHMNDATEVAWGVDAATTALQARLRYMQNFRPTDGDGLTSTGGGTVGMGPFSGNWDYYSNTGGRFIYRAGVQSPTIPQIRDIKPEVGRFLADLSWDDISRFNTYFDLARPVFYLAKGGTNYYQETIHDFPEDTQGLFMLKALARRADNKLSADALRKYLDIPWVKQDYFYLERLVRNIEAYGTTTWTDLRSLPAPSTPPAPSVCNGASDVQAFETQTSLAGAGLQTDAVIANIGGTNYIYVTRDFYGHRSLVKGALDGNGSIALFSNQPNVPANQADNESLITASFGGNHYLYIIGGAANNVSQAVISKALLDPSGDAAGFTANPTPLPQALSDPVLVKTEINGIAYLYIIGGITNGAAQSTVYRAAFDPASGDISSFVAQTPLPAARAGGSACIVRNYLYVLGGSASATVWRAAIDASGNLGNFSSEEQTQLPQLPLDGHSLVALNINGANYLYLIGGGNWSDVDWQTTVFKAKIDSNGNIGRFSTLCQGQLPQSSRYQGLVTANYADSNYLYVLGLHNSGGVYRAKIGGNSAAGDVNQDTQVDVLDIQACVNHILGIQDLGNRADANSDGSVNVLDVQGIVNIILGV